MKNFKVFALYAFISFGLIHKEIKPSNISYAIGCAGQISILPVSGYSLYKLYQLDTRAGASGTIALSSFLVSAGASIWDSVSADSRQDNAAKKRQKGLGNTHGSLIKTGFWVGSISGLAALYFLYKKIYAK